MSLKLYVIDSTKEIPCLNNICGPLTEPVSLQRENVIDLLKRGFVVYQVNPHDKTEKVLVTRSNINSITFKNTRAGAISRKLLNRQIQEMSTPVTVDVVRRSDSKSTQNVTEKKVDTKTNNNTSSENKNKNKQNDNSTNTTETKEETKVTTPDGFSK